MRLGSLTSELRGGEGLCVRLGSHLENLLSFPSCLPWSQQDLREGRVGCVCVSGLSLVS